MKHGESIRKSHGAATGSDKRLGWILIHKKKYHLVNKNYDNPEEELLDRSKGKKTFTWHWRLHRPPGKIDVTKDPVRLLLAWNKTIFGEANVGVVHIPENKDGYNFQFVLKNYRSRKKIGFDKLDIPTGGGSLVKLTKQILKQYDQAIKQ